MLDLKKLKYTVAAIAVCGVVGYSANVQAQTNNATAAVTVQNAVTLTPVNSMNWGTVVAIAQTGAGAPATDAVNPDGTQGTVVSAVAPAGRIIVVNATALSNFEINITNGAPSATINVTVSNVVNPTDTLTAFTLDTFMYVDTVTAAVPAAVVVGAPFGIPLSGTGTNTLQLGATINTVAAAAYADAIYNGTFDVTFAY